MHPSKLNSLRVRAARVTTSPQYPLLVIQCLNGSVLQMRLHKTQPCVTAGVAYNKDPMLLQGFKPQAKALILVMSPYE